MTTFGNKNMPNLCHKFYCEKCDYGTSKKSSFVNHCESNKHKKHNITTNSNDFMPKLCSKIYTCNKCEKKYNERTGLWRHKKKCNDETTINQLGITDKELINILIQQNQKLMNIVENGTNNNNNNNSHNTTNIDNKTFNLNFFLNETCKDAMNISDFVSSIKVSLSDLENTGRQGYVEGITNIVLKNLNKVQDNLRPIHCSDVKREVFYIKDNNEWQKENQEKPILTKVIKVIANENIKQINNWRDKYPDCTDSDSKKNNLYLKIVSNSMNGSTQEEGNKNIDKIISNVAKEVAIDKTK
jgi:hypothetical protein